MLDVTEQEATVLGTFTGSLEGVTVEATLIANGQSPFRNLPPVANAGPDQVVTCGAATHLDGSGTTDPNNNLLLLRWSEAGVNIGFGAVLDLLLGNGTHDILLEAFDTFEGLGTDHVVVQVVPDTTPPVFTSVPPGITIHDCAAPDIGVAQAVDDCGVTSLTSDAPAVFPLGLTVVTWTAIDAAGNRTTATQQVFAELGDNPSCCPTGTNVIIGTSGHDVLNGTAERDCILGLDGDDIIFGNDGDDFLSGGAGDDHVFGGGHDGNGPHQSVFNDYLVGGDGNDKLFGGRGNDILLGDGGNDLIHGNGGNDIVDGGPGTDLCRAEAPSTITVCEK
jgi:Ca2+-binding RTX toxin-like protein